jgi:hypothetical protein
LSVKIKSPEYRYHSILIFINRFFLCVCKTFSYILQTLIKKAYGRQID